MSADTAPAIPATIRYTDGRIAQGTVSPLDFQAVDIQNLPLGQALAVDGVMLNDIIDGRATVETENGDVTHLIRRGLGPGL